MPLGTRDPQGKWVRGYPGFGLKKPECTQGPGKPHMTSTELFVFGTFAALRLSLTERYRVNGTPRCARMVSQSPFRSPSGVSKTCFSDDLDSVDVPYWHLYVS